MSFGRRPLSPEADPDFANLRRETLQRKSSLTAVGGQLASGASIPSFAEKNLRTVGDAQRRDIQKILERLRVREAGINQARQAPGRRQTVLTQRGGTLLNGG